MDTPSTPNVGSSDSGGSQKRKRGLILRKSRTGCQDCRLRRVKCDEIKPVCSNCRRRYVGIECCNWTRAAPSRRARGGSQSSDLLGPESDGSRGAASPFSSSMVTTNTCNSNSTTEIPASLDQHPHSLTMSGPWRALELRLMYHYTAVVGETMPECMRDAIPKYSFEYEVILNPMLAFSAIHLHAHSPHDSAVAVALRRYLDRSLVDHRQALAGNSGLSEQLWISAVLLSHVHWLLAHQRQPNEPYELPLQPWRMLLAIGNLFEEEYFFLSQLGYRWFSEENYPAIQQERLPAPARAKIQVIEKELEDLLTAFDFSEFPPDDQSVYLQVKDYVLHQYRAYYSGAALESLWRYVAFMAVTRDSRYHKMLGQHDPLAMALMARITVLLKYIESPWWISGRGDYEVVERDVCGVRELMPADSKWAMDWPCDVLDGKIHISRDEQSANPEQALAV